MKPDGRALDIAVVGLGQAGGNLAAELHRRGYRALALNTAQTDLSALDAGGVVPELPSERRVYVGLDGYDGAGADPAYGQDCLREHADRIRSEVLEQAASADVVLLCAGLGGGTGSALFELVKILQSEELPLVALMTLPTESESGLAKVNAVRALNEVVNAPLLGWIFADNDRISALNPDVSIVDYFAHVNAKILAPLDELNRLNAREDLTPIRSFDGEDFRKLLLSGGVLNYAVTPLEALTVEATVAAVHGAIEASELMPSGFDLARMSYLGWVIEAPQSALEGASIRVFESIGTELKALTEGAAVYPGIYRAESAGPIVLRLIASTQSLPRRMREILADARREGQLLEEKVAEPLPSLELGDISGFDLFRTQTRPSARPGRARPAPKAPRAAAEPLEDAADAPARPSRGLTFPEDEEPTPAPRPRPAPGSSGSARVGRPAAEVTEPSVAVRPRRPRRRPPAPQSAEPDETSEADPTLGRSEPPIATDGVDTGDLPDPKAYDAWVARYEAATDDAERAEVKARLEADAASDIDVVRYYAVEAMVKLGAAAFGPALARATEDEHEEIRRLASGAAPED